MAEPTLSPPFEQAPASVPVCPAPDWRLHKHADYQRVYGVSRKQFSQLMAYFAAPRPAETATAVRRGPRIGLTTGRVLGKAVERNRIKRRMRAAVRQTLPLLTRDLDVVLHPKRNVLAIPFPALLSDIEGVFRKIETAEHHPQQTPRPPRSKRRSA